MANKPKSYNFRSSETGKYVKEKYAKAHPSTTEKEKRDKPVNKKD